MVAKLEIENERLKKGYWVKGVGANKAYVTAYDETMKSLKDCDSNIVSVHF